MGVDTSDGIQINDAKVLSADRLTDNGVIHAIDKVLVPSLVSV
ncbi:fasciclin domain-containing protein [Laspinema olomoucense]|nr:fasciclin domain-containing protein [Laspinema sp. D3d]MCT7974666.1 fasciclin domain-containing protein [Laspinema sp. D3d]